jgi:hypothetical protein
MFAEAQEETFRKVAKNRALVERSIVISRGITFFYPNGVRTGQDVKEILAAKALGLMQSLTAEERDAFLRNTRGKIMSIFDREDVFGLFEGDCTDPEAATDRKVDLLREILSYEKEFNVLFQAYRDLYVQDVMEKDESEYNEMYAQPILSGEIPPAAIYAKLLDLAYEPEKKIAEVGPSGPYYNDREMMELLKTMMNVYYPLSDAMGLGTTLAIKIRRNATEMLENLLKRKAEAGEHTKEDVETLALYELCKEYCDYIRGPAQQLAESFILSGKLQGIIDSLSKRFEVRIELASHTSNKDDVYRIKGPSGNFWKIKKYRKKGIEDYNIHKIKDELAATLVVDGTFEDAKVIANRLTRELKQSLRASEINIKSVPRETGYTVPHVTCKVKVGDAEVPFEIQVRPAETHVESRVGELSHAAKISGFITGPLVEKLKTTFKEMEAAHDTLRLSRKDLPKADTLHAKFSVRVFDGTARKVKALGSKVITAYNGECVGGIVALSVGLGKAVEVTDEREGHLDLFEKCPGNITINIKKGPGINKETCKMLMDGKVITPKALEVVSSHCKSLPRKGLLGRLRRGC